MIALVLLAALGQYEAGAPLRSAEPGARMRFTLVSAAYAAPADAPMATVGETPLLEVRSIQAGEPAPYAGYVMDDVAGMKWSRAARACELERADLRTRPAWWVVAAAAGVALAAGVGLGYALKPAARVSGPP